ncbi:hypothetical protein KR215_011062 [Drosophila sulfurigaster]|nr:hypothetical protein KR215_011062 [Drosophila sulfurigaster]
MTMVFLAFLYRVGRIVGLCNFRYEPRSGLFERDRGSILLYWIVLHMVYVLLLPCIFYMLVLNYYECQRLDMLAMAYSIVAIAKAVSIFNLVFSIWLLITKWLRVVNGFMMFQHIYCKRLSGRVKFWHYLWKPLLTVSRFSLLFLQLFGPSSIFMCNRLDGMRTPFAPLYIVLSLAFVFMEVLLTCANYWIYYLINLTNQVLGFMSEEMQGLRQDLSGLLKRRDRHRKIYQQQLFAAWHKLWFRCLRLDRVIHKMVKVCQWHILLDLFACYLSDITIVFNLIVYSTEYDNFYFPVFILLMMLDILFHSDIMSIFVIFGINRGQWAQLLASMEELWFTFGSIDFDPSADIYIILQLSFAIMAVNRRQHPRHYRVRRLQIAGLFDMSPRSGYNMSTDIAMNVVILCQIAYKYYY